MLMQLPVNSDADSAVQTQLHQLVQLDCCVHVQYSGLLYR